MKSIKYKFINGNKIKDKTFFKKEIDLILKECWGSHPDDYLDEHIISAHFLYLVSTNNKIVGFAACQRYFFENKPLYYLAFTAVHPEHQGNDLQAKLNLKIFYNIFFENIIRGRISVETLNISPNPRVLGSILRSAKYVFPNPKLPLRAPDDVWEKVIFLIKKVGDPIDKLSRNGCVNMGFYEDPKYSHLIYDEKTIPKDKDRVVNDFAMKLLTPEKKIGREMIIYARYSVFNLLNYYFKNKLGVK